MRSPSTNSAARPLSSLVLSLLIAKLGAANRPHAKRHVSAGAQRVREQPASDTCRTNRGRLAGARLRSAPQSRTVLGAEGFARRVRNGDRAFAGVRHPAPAEPRAPPEPPTPESLEAWDDSQGHPIAPRRDPNARDRLHQAEWLGALGKKNLTNLVERSTRSAPLNTGREIGP